MAFFNLKLTAICLYAEIERKGVGEFCVPFIGAGLGRRRVGSLRSY
jgi:hypothetical protein